MKYFFGIRSHNYFFDPNRWVQIALGFGVCDKPLFTNSSRNSFLWIFFYPKNHPTIVFSARSDGFKYRGRRVRNSSGSGAWSNAIHLFRDSVAECWSYKLKVEGSIPSEKKLAAPSCHQSLFFLFLSFVRARTRCFGNRVVWIRVGHGTHDRGRREEKQRIKVEGKKKKISVDVNINNRDNSRECTETSPCKLSSRQ